MKCPVDQLQGEAQDGRLGGGHPLPARDPVRRCRGLRGPHPPPPPRTHKSTEQPKLEAQGQDEPRLSSMPGAGTTAPKGPTPS